MSDQTTANQSANSPVAQVDAPLNVQVVERLEEADKNLLDLAKAKRELAIANAKLAVSQSETADLTYNNLVLRFAVKYHLSEGDLLGEDGTITRKVQK